MSGRSVSRAISIGVPELDSMSGVALARRRHLAIGRFPQRTEQCKPVSPLSFTALIGAPFCSSKSTNATPPRMHAMCSGVSSFWLTAATCAPRCSIERTSARYSGLRSLLGRRRTAKCNGVLPSGVLALRSIPSHASSVCMF